MILLHLVVAALYACAAWALWPAPATAPQGPAIEARPSLHPSPELLGWLVPAALMFHAWLCYRDIVSSDGLDLSLDNAVALVAGLVAALAYVSGLLRTLPVV